MIVYIGDTHGSTEKIAHCIRKRELTEGDTVVILGDAGINYYGDERDLAIKALLNHMGVTIFCIHGNHEQCPEELPAYHLNEWRGGSVYVEDEFPNLLFDVDGEIYDMDGYQTIVIGGVYSADKYRRLAWHLRWFPNEQLTDETKAKVESKLDSLRWKVDLVLSHTSPSKFLPTETFLPFADQSTVNRTTEKWLDTIEERVTYRKWLCGHWHMDKSIGHFRFIMKDLVVLPPKGRKEQYLQETK